MKIFFQKLVCFTLLALFFVNSVVPPDFARAQVPAPSPNLLISLSPHYSPAIVRGLSIYPDDPFKFDFIIDDVLVNVAPHIGDDAGIEKRKLAFAAKGSLTRE